MADEDLPEPPGVYTLTTEAGDKPTSIGFSGQAKATYPNGDVYEGMFDNGQRHGNGKFTYRDTQDVFEGTFVNNLKAGVGRVTYKKGGFFHGNFKDGLREGEGTFKYPNGDIYSGMWKAGKKHGKGTYVFGPTKYELKGEWKDGNIVEGTWTFTDGTRYIGMFKQQKPCGDGLWEMSKGTVVEGTYNQQMLPVDAAALPTSGPPVCETRIFWKTATMVEAEG
mmetsp:Transcript_39956/g.92028  ORF Transcript_39956/g.92028 Transcript_39956/m.92028 type:complete len:222 (-) Transcript_39956:78-743(-)